MVLSLRDVAFVCAGALLVSALLWVFCGACRGDDDCFASDPVFVQQDRRSPAAIDRNKLGDHNRLHELSLERHPVAPSAGPTRKPVVAVPPWVKVSAVVFSGSAALFVALVLFGNGSLRRKDVFDVGNDN